jgi:formylmethanofuran dehydrogenase subunit D
MKHSHSKSQCAACNLWFSSETSFNKHRTGSYGEPIYKGKDVDGYEKSTRRCMNEEEMKVLGMTKNDKGLWVTSLFEGETSFWIKKEEVAINAR